MMKVPFLKNNSIKGICCILLSSLFFSLMSMFVRLAGDLPVMQKAFFRNSVAAIVATILLLRTKEKFHMQKGSFPFLLARAFFGTLGLVLNFWAVDSLGLADANILNKLSPFFAIVISIFLLKEKPTKVEIACVILAFTGAVFIVKPGAGLVSIPALGGFISGLCAGTAYSFVRRLGLHGERGPLIVFFFSVFSCIVLVPYIILRYQPMTGRQLLCLLACGICAATAQFCITAAYTFAPAKEISVFDYTQVIFAAIIGFILFDEIPDYLSFIGYAIIIGSAIFKWAVSMRAHHKEDK